jgi:hypothetical protein
MTWTRSAPTAAAAAAAALALFTLVLSPTLAAAQLGDASVDTSTQPRRPHPLRSSQNKTFHTAAAAAAAAAVVSAEYEAAGVEASSRSEPAGFDAPPGVEASSRSEPDSVDATRNLRDKPANTECAAPWAGAYTRSQFSST